MNNTELVLRTCNADGTSYGGFQWPLEVGERVKAPDWDPAPRCGGGLHGALHGQGVGSLLDWSEDAIWLVVEMPSDEIVDLGGTAKAPWAIVRHVGDQDSATEYLAKHGHTEAVIGATVTAGYKGIATAGFKGTATAGVYGTATAGFKGTATAGDYGTATAGFKGTATAGFKGTATAGLKGTATARFKGTATAGDYGTATAGNRGTATAGNYGTATAGNYGTATAGNRGTAAAGDYGEIRIRYYDRQANRDRTKVGYIGEDGLQPDTEYQLNGDQEFVEVHR